MKYPHEVFTPLTEDLAIRLTFPGSEVEVLHGDVNSRGLGYKGEVRIAGRRFAVHGQRCGAPQCNCDASITWIPEA